jgi:hypothetical protein
LRYFEFQGLFQALKIIKPVNGYVVPLIKDLKQKKYKKKLKNIEKIILKIALHYAHLDFFPKFIFAFLHFGP